MSDVFDTLSSVDKGNLQRADQPNWVDPMLVTLTDRRFSDDGWIFERKLDGEHCLALRDGRGVRLMSRNKKDC